MTSVDCANIYSGRKSNRKKDV